MDYTDSQREIISRVGKSYDIFIAIMTHCGGFFPFEEFAIVSGKPEAVFYESNSDRLHNEKGPAIRYKDGFEVYAYKGVSIPSWVIEKKREEIDPTEILRIRNVEEKRAIFNIIGDEFFYSKLGGRVLDRKFLFIDRNHKVFTQPEGVRLKQIVYELLEIDVGLREKIKVLKMQNPSVDNVRHYEKVGNNCANVLDAFEFRTHVRALPEYLS